MDNINENVDIFDEGNIEKIENKPMSDEEFISEDEALEEDRFYGTGDKTYVKKSERYEDVRSSAYTMLIVGMLGVIFVILSLVKIINLPFNATTAWLFYTIMSVVFIAFVVGGFISLMKANKLKDEAETEDNKIDEINTWAKENLSVTILDAGLDVNQPVEILYFSRAEKIKNMLMHQFEDVDEGLIDLITENLYTELYEGDKPTDDEDEEITEELSE